MDSSVIHIPQGSILKLQDGEIEYLRRSFEERGIGLGAIDFKQDLVIFPQQYVGYINFPTRKVIIDPKHEGVELKHILRIYYFLYASDDSDLDDPIYDIDAGNSNDVIELFLSELDKVVKKGLPVEYRNDRENLAYLRGNINVVNTMMNKSLGRKELFDCSYDNLSRDIAINQVLLKAFTKASLVTDIGRAGLLKQDFVGISDIHDIPDVALTTNTMYCKKALTLAYMIINNLSISDYGNQAYGQNLLINFDRLFEDFVKKVLVTYSGDYNFSYWDEEKDYALCTSANDTFYKSYIPDMVYLYQERETPASAECILDMKNKTSKPFSNADVYQMFFYANQLHSKRVILCYPSSVARGNALLKFNNESFSLKKLNGVYVNIAGNTANDFKNNIFDFIDKVRELI